MVQVIVERIDDPIEKERFLLKAMQAMGLAKVPSYLDRPHKMHVIDKGEASGKKLEDTSC